MLSLEPVASPADIRDEWDRLATASGNVFGTWEWATAWERHLGKGRPLALYACRRADGEVAAVLPLYLTAMRPVRLLRFLGHGPADQLGPVCSGADAPAVARALLELVRLRPLGARGLLAERLPADQNWAELLGPGRLRRESSPVLDTAGRSWNEFVASRSRNFREQVGRRERKLGREHRLSIRLTTDTARLDDDFDTFVRLHALRWGQESAFTGARARFHRDFAHLSLERGWLRLWLLEVDGSAVAAWYGFRFAGIDSYYNASRDPAWDSRSVGFVLLTHTIRTAFEDGMKEYRFLLGDEPYKDRFAGRDPGLETVLVGPRSLARAAAIGAAAAAVLPARGRRLLKRLG